MTSKICSKCGEKYPIENFGKDKSKKDGLRPSCKICKQKTDKVYREKNLEKVKKIDLEYRKKHRKEANKRAKNMV